MVEHSPLRFAQACFEHKPYGLELSFAENSGIPVRTLETLACNFYVTLHGSTLGYMNQSNAVTLGAASTESLIGKSLFDICSKRDAMESAQNDNWVKQNNSLLICEEQLSVQGILTDCLSIKIPLWHQQCIIGIFGFSIYYGRDPFASVLSQITQSGLLGGDFCLGKAKKSADIVCHLSRREKECLYYTMRGKTAREIARLLGLSHRTIEKNIESLKTKLNMHNRSELIDYAWKELRSINLFSE
ncbi:response regulator transcription factor [Legionella sp. CNM-4043-24]|uniref:response regulator transcription factor n=1 Tax=Legionella sp. CNM-4043-24 TaxID=3421646 RepID=UPI00403AA6F7